MFNTFILLVTLLRMATDGYLRLISVEMEVSSKFVAIVSGPEPKIPKTLLLRRALEPPTLVILW